MLHKHFPELVDLTMVPMEQDCSFVINFDQVIDLFLIQMLNKKMPRDCQYIYYAPGGDNVFYKKLMVTPMDHLHCCQELLCISKKLSVGNILVLNKALKVEWLYMSFHKSNHAKFICSGNKLSKEMLQTLAKYFQSILDVRVGDGSLQNKRDDQICQSTAHRVREEVPQQVESYFLQSWQTTEQHI